MNMRSVFFILALVALNAHAVDCIRPMFEYFASHYMTENLNLYILPGRMNPDSLHQEQESLVITIKYHWTQNRLDSMTFTHTCQDDIYRETMKVDWKVDSSKVGKLMKYDWIFPDKRDNFTVFRGKDSVAIVKGKEQIHSSYIKNDTIRGIDNYIPRDWIIFRDPKNENRCTQVNGKEITTYEFEKRNNTLILSITEPDHSMYVKHPGPCEGGDKYTTIFFH